MMVVGPNLFMYTYLFKLSEDGVLEVKAGKGYNPETRPDPNDPTDEASMNVIQKGSIQLSKEQLAQLKPLIKEISKTETLEPYPRRVTDATVISIYINEKNFGFVYGWVTNPKFEEFAEKLIEFSPIPIIRGGEPITPLSPQYGQ